MRKRSFMTLSIRENMGPKNANSSQALLLANEGYADEAIAERVGIGPRGIAYMRQRLGEEGFEVSLEEKPRGLRPRILSGEDEARLITLMCGPAPEGCARWT
jgi:transposase